MPVIIINIDIILIIIIFIMNDGHSMIGSGIKTLKNEILKNNMTKINTFHTYSNKQNVGQIKKIHLGITAMYLSLQHAHVAT